MFVTCWSHALVGFTVLFVCWFSFGSVFGSITDFCIFLEGEHNAWRLAKQSEIDKPTLPEHVTNIKRASCNYYRKA
jgi:hypothetical protein